MAEQGFRFGPVLTDKVISVVKRVEDMPYRYGNASIPTRFEDDGFGGGGGSSFRICTFTGSWSKSATKSVTFKYQTTTPNTVAATNLFADISVDCGERDCAIARDGTAWFLISAECS